MKISSQPTDQTTPAASSSGERGSSSPLYILLVGVLIIFLLVAAFSLINQLAWQNAETPTDIPVPTLSDRRPTSAPTQLQVTPDPATPTPSATPSSPPTPENTPTSTSTSTATPSPTATRPATASYTVQAGDTLSEIAARLGTDLQALASYNQITNPGMIHVGQVLYAPPSGYAGSPLPTPSGQKRIYVDLSEQRLYAYQGDTLVYSFIVSTGKDDPTWTGSFSILDKNPYAFSEPWGFYMPNWMGIYYEPSNGYNENGFHGLPVLTSGEVIWSETLGTPASYGCVVLGSYDSKLLFDWAEVGTPVEIRN